MQKRKGAVNTFVVIFFKYYKNISAPSKGVWHAEK
ncbi:hypothetical protein F469_03149 [Pseudomonas sp. URMO17WK12:I2]|nr:hypothetical protein F469_03149 [Pseudomonas sp. URMO17WK12:I2]